MSKNVLIIVLFAAVAALGWLVVRKNSQLETVSKRAEQEREVWKAHAESLSKNAQAERKKERTRAVEPAKPADLPAATTGVKRACNRLATGYRKSDIKKGLCGND